MSAMLNSLLDSERRQDCERNDMALRTMTRAHLQMRSYGTPTTRRYARTMAEAFPDIRAAVFEPHVAPPLWKRVELFFRRRLS